MAITFKKPEKSLKSVSQPAVGSTKVSVAASVATASSNTKVAQPNKAFPDDYVGDKHPPKKYQFKPGQSGNPNGRPKKFKDVNELFADELKKLITVIEKGEKFKTTKKAALVKSIVNKALAGDAKCTNHVLKHLPLADEVQLKKNPDRPLDAIDEEILRLYRQRLEAELATAANDETTSETDDDKNEHKSKKG